jgi:transcriptional regulator with XRE-family HTH domain
VVRGLPPMNPRSTGPHPLLAAVGQAIARRRRAAGLRQADLAERCSVGRVFVSYVENGRRNPSVLALACLAEALDCTLSDLFADAGF